MGLEYVMRCILCIDCKRGTEVNTGSNEVESVKYGDDGERGSRKG